MKSFPLSYRTTLSITLLLGLFFIKTYIAKEIDLIEEKNSAAASEIEKLITYNTEYIKYQFLYAGKQIANDNIFSNDHSIAKILRLFVNGINSQVDIAITWNAFSWINNKGKVTVDGSIGVVKPIDISNRDYLKITSSAPNRLIFGKSLQGAISGRFIVPMAMGVFDKNKKYLGTLVLGLDIERLLSKITKSIDDKIFSFAVTNNSDITFTSDNLSSENLALTQQEIQKSNPTFGTISKQNLFSKNRSFIASIIIGDTPLRVIVFYDKEKSYNQILSAFVKSLSLVLLIFFAMSAFFQRIYRKIVKPINQLSEFALRIGKGDFSFNVAKPKTKELINLFDALQLLKSTLQHKYKTLDQNMITQLNHDDTDDQKE